MIQPRTPRTGTSRGSERQTRHDHGPAATTTCAASMRPSSVSTPVTSSPRRSSSRTAQPVRISAPEARASSASAAAAAPGSMRRALRLSQPHSAASESSGSASRNAAPSSSSPPSSSPSMRQPYGSRSNAKAPPLRSCRSTRSSSVTRPMASIAGGLGPITSPWLRPEAACASPADSHSVTASPRRAHEAATAMPTMPPPTTTTSGEPVTYERLAE